jgi:hypothetical protein
MNNMRIMGMKTHSLWELHGIEEVKVEEGGGRKKQFSQLGGGLFLAAKTSDGPFFDPLQTHVCSLGLCA